MPTSLFLKKEMVAAAQKAVVYDLEEEFRKARKNRGFTLIIPLLLFAALLLGGTFGLTSYIEHRNKNIEISITDFEDINMQELLSSLRNAGRLLDDMKHSMDVMKGEIDLKMQGVRLKAREELELLRKNHNLSVAQRAAMSRKILEDRERKIAAMNAEYEIKLKNKEKSIEEAKLKMGDYKVQLQRKMDIYVGNLEVKLKEYRGESKESKAKAELLVQQMGENHALKSREEKKDQEKKLQELSIKLKDAEGVLHATNRRAEDLEFLLSHYRKALTHYAFMRGEQGHIVGIRKDGNFLVVLNPMVELGKTARGLVVDKKGAVIARIEIFSRDNMTTARVLKKMSSVKISPFDMIIVQKE